MRIVQVGQHDHLVVVAIARLSRRLWASALWRSALSCEVPDALLDAQLEPSRAARWPRRVPDLAQHRVEVGVAADFDRPLGSTRTP
jgi:hypothetical protein